MNSLLRLIIVGLAILIAGPAHAQDKQQWPPDARDVMLAIASKMTNRPGPRAVTFASGTDADMVGAKERLYANFTRAIPAPVSYQTDRAGSAYNADLAGFLHLLAPDGRLANLRFVARYTVNGEHIQINQCVVTQASPAIPQLSTFMIPAEKFKQLPHATRTDWAKFYDFARKNAYNPQRDTAGKTNYYVVSFVMDQLPGSAKFEAIAGNSKTTRRKQDNIAKGKEAYLDYLGWRVHMFKVKCSPTSQKERFYVNYFYTPGSDVIESTQERTQIARFDSKPTATGPSAPMQQAPPLIKQQQVASAKAPQQAAPAPVAEQSPPVQQPAKVEHKQPAQQPDSKQAPAKTTPPTAPGDGPYALGKAFLNPIFPEDVATIQTRLKQLGYYQGPIDQNWGPQIKQALDDFSAKHGFPKGMWSLGLQKALFKGTGL